VGGLGARAPCGACTVHILIRRHSDIACASPPVPYRIISPQTCRSPPLKAPPLRRLSAPIRRRRGTIFRARAAQTRPGPRPTPTRAMR
jgi:hypothetical protein